MNENINILDIFAERLMDLIKENNLSIKSFAEKVDIPRTTILGWLHKIRTPRIDYLSKIADYFCVTTDYLLGRED